MDDKKLRRMRLQNLLDFHINDLERSISGESRGYSEALQSRDNRIGMIILDLGNADQRKFYDDYRKYLAEWGDEK